MKKSDEARFFGKTPIFPKKKKFRKKKFSGPRKNGRFRPYLGQKISFRHAVFCKSLKMIPSNYLCNLNKIVRAVFEKSGKKLIFGPFWPLFGQNLAKKIFFRKSGSVSIFYLIFPNFSQKIRKILRREVPKL